MKIILHAGAQKTGSTSLQRWFYKNEQNLNSISVTCPKRLFVKKHIDPIHRMISRLIADKNPQKQKKDFSSRIQQIFAETGCQTILLSHENTFGLPYSNTSTAFYPDFEQRVIRLKALLSDLELDVEVIFFVREFGAFIRSSYVQYVRQGGTQSLPAFFERIDMETISWLRLANILHDAFPNMVRIVAYEDFFQAAAANVNEVFFADQFDARFCADLEDIKVNRSPSLMVVDAARMLNKLLRKTTNLPRRKVGQFSSNYVIALFENWFRFGGTSLPSAYANSLRQQYHEELKLIRDRHKLQVQEIR